MDSGDFSFGKFSKNEFYGELNARLVDMTDVSAGQHIIDLACGSGRVTQLVLKRLRGARDSVVIAIDTSALALKQAMEELREDLKEARTAAVHFVQSSVEQVSDAVKESVDTVIFCNAIHYIADKDSLMEEISKTLKPGGKFAFNTSFFDGAQSPETVVFYRRWMLKASRILRREYGLSPVRDTKVEARKHLTAEQYKQLVESHGFQVIKQEIDQVRVPLGGWIDISGFEDFITGTMPGVPLDKASASLKEAAAQTYRELDIEYVSRNWLDVVAVRG